jgi:hypothetical protein
VYKASKVTARTCLNFERISKEVGVELKLETIWVSPAMNLDLIAVGFVKDLVKEAEYDRELIS